MIHRKTHARIPNTVVAVLFFILLSAFCWSSGLSPREMRIWTQLYSDLHPDIDPHWPQGGPRAWARIERERLEPIVASILRGEHENIPWNYGLTFVAPLMPTPPICDAVLARMESVFSKKLATRAPLDEREHGSLSSMVSVLAAGNDRRATSVLNEILRRDEYSYHTARKYVLAIRMIGGESSLHPLRDMPLRKRNDTIDRMAELAERIIQARIEGKTFPPETAPEELRARTLVFLRALERRDLNGLKNSFPAQFQEIMDQQQLTEFLDGTEREDTLPLIRAALDARTPFEIDRDIEIDQEYFQAKLVCDNRYVVEFIYEIDGWKLMNIGPVPAPRASPAPPIYPENRGGRRIFIGKPAADDDNR